jgi:DNA repair protein RecN (Recombination protein N)
MLSHLHIKNIALIDELDIDFAPGLNVMTGETGAGKSIIVDSMNLVLGERADRDLIKSGEENASVEAVFDISNTSLKSTLEEYGLSGGDDTLVFSRELSSAGKNICRINGRLATLSVLKEISDRMVDLHGQHEHQSLLDEKKHLSFLDKYAGEPVRALREQTACIFEDYRAAQKKLRDIAGKEGERDRRLDILQFQMNEIKNAKISEGEEEALLFERDKMQNSEKITTALGFGYDALYEGAGGEPILGMLKQVNQGLSEISRLDERYAKLQERLQEAYYGMEEAAFELRDLKDEFSFDPKRLEEIENRLELLHTLKRKYGGSIGAILDFYTQAQNEYNDLLDSEHLIGELNKIIVDIKEKLLQVSGQLTQKRREAALRFEQDVMAQLADLGLKSARFEVRFLETPEDAFSAEGSDTVEFYIATNPGEPLKPLKKVVSGGEISRIMLGLKNISAGLDELQCLIFDEIDTGISGHMAHVVGEKMRNISQKRQVICVTHLAQIAALADRHFLITKQTGADRAQTSVLHLSRDRRVLEIARLAGGSESPAALAHAEELLARAEGLKNGG